VQPPFELWGSELAPDERLAPVFAPTPAPLDEAAELPPLPALVPF
jgi:hypothetical protein